MHLYEGSPNHVLETKSKMSVGGSGLRRQAPVTVKPPKLRLGSRAVSLQQQQIHPHHQQQQQGAKMKVWLPDSESGSLECVLNTSVENNEVKYGDQAHLCANSANSSSSRPLIHHQRHNLKNRFQLLKTLGEGTYGKVKLAVDKASGENVAVKYIKKTKIQDENDLVRIRREIQILSSLRHKHVVNIREVFEKKDKIVLVMDYAEGGELYDYLNKMGKLSEWEARRIFRQIVSAIHCCHQNGIVHRDLKLENIILDDEGNVKIADFGLANYYSHNNTLKTFCGSPLYASPEIVNGKPYHGPEVDVWSLGVILYTLVYGAMPFESNNLVSLKQQISNGEYNQPSKPSDAAGLIRHMLTVTPSRRATMEDALRHWWVNFGHTHMPNDMPYSPDDEPPVMPYMMAADDNVQPTADPPVIIHHRNQSSISSDSDVELDFRPNRWSKRKLTLDSTGSSLSSSVAGSPAPTLDSCGPEEDGNDDAAITSALLKLPAEVLEILKGCSSKSLAALLNTDKISSGFDLDVNETNNNQECQTSERREVMLDSDKTSASVFDSERKPKRGILKRKGKFSGGDSGCVMHEEMAARPEDNPIPKSGHLPRRLPSFRDEAHGIFASKHRASQLLDEADVLHRESCSSAISQTAWCHTSTLSPRQHHGHHHNHRQQQQNHHHHHHNHNHHSHPRPQQTRSSLQPHKYCLTENTSILDPNVTKDLKSGNLPSDPMSQNPALVPDKSSPSPPRSPKQPSCHSDSAKSSPGDSPSVSPTPSKEQAKVVPRPKSILKNSKLSQLEEARNRLSVSSIGSNSSADFLDLSYDSGDSDHFINQGAGLFVPTNGQNGCSDNSCVMLSTPKVPTPENLCDNKELDGLKPNEAGLTCPLSPGHQRTLSDESAEILDSKSSLLYRLTRDAHSLL